MAIEVTNYSFSLILLIQSICQVAGERAEYVQLRIKASKTNKSNKSEYVEIFESRNVTCPVKALKKFLSATKHIDKSAPVFCNDDFHKKSYLNYHPGILEHTSYYFFYLIYLFG